ncbi:MraZ protein [Rhodobium orientis]|uniref:Transcriptional regulator MraZ n=1 Tax=Rhodobium orientis TaxID=34017 RepID=A0A327JPE8_9HYPH|nr:division/cell wall cluster transcriptional repressor MraZ [Rhodobium orientis]MBB4305470.1 MraZ protein [Rhodobium orientis]MBK5948666.1 division/cell wall cluster transcriptional repressor MraZ [Rhodobium orientis]RAI25288.1 division/cell wall cluster transcriptional repressor MraZ [Rhodobium orientis]
MSGFVGHFTNRIDAKGRVSVPAPFRAELARDGYDGLFCIAVPDLGTIDAGGNALRETLDRHIAQFEPLSFDHNYLSTALLGLSEQLRIDADGRISLTDTLKEAAGIDAQVTFVGQGFKFQIWTPERFAEHRAEALRRVQSLRRGAGAPSSGPDGGGHT